MWLGLVGGYGSGKTISLAQKSLYMTIKNQGWDGALLMPTNSMVRRVIKPALEEALEATGLIAITRLIKADLIYQINFSDKIQSQIYLLSAENFQRAAGLNLAWFGIDEFDLIDTDVAEEAWRMMVSRIRKGPHSQGFTTSTPEGHKFLYRFFEEDVEKAIIAGSPLTDRRLIRANTEDNPFLPDSYIENLKAQFPPHLLEAYLHGKFVVLAGTLVYWRFDKSVNCSNYTLNDFPDSVLHLGVDFNKKINACPVSVVRNGSVYVIDEIYGSEDANALALEIKRRYPRHYKENALKFYPDASGYEGIQTLKRNFEVYSNDAKPNFRYGNKNPAVDRRVAAVNQKFRPIDRPGPDAYINPNKAPMLYKGLTQQVYDKNDDPDKSAGIDHSIDAFGYFIHNRFPLTGRGPTARIL